MDGLEKLIEACAECTALCDNIIAQNMDIVDNLNFIKKRIEEEVKTREAGK